MELIGSQLPRGIAIKTKGENSADRIDRSTPVPRHGNYPLQIKRAIKVLINDGRLDFSHSSDLTSVEDEHLYEQALSH